MVVQPYLTSQYQVLIKCTFYVINGLVQCFNRSFHEMYSKLSNRNELQITAAETEMNINKKSNCMKEELLYIILYNFSIPPSVEQLVGAYPPWSAAEDSYGLAARQRLIEHTPRPVIPIISAYIHMIHPSTVQ